VVLDTGVVVSAILLPPVHRSCQHGGAKASNLPRCRDPHDQKFLALAQAGNAETLVTGDRALLALVGQARFAIETPAAFRRRYDAP
jgi:predicted nucleic acid-binding protein